MLHRKWCSMLYGTMHHVALYSVIWQSIWSEHSAYWMCLVTPVSRGAALHHIWCGWTIIWFWRGLLSVGTRAFATSCCDHELASRTNSFIQEHVRVVIERSQEFLRLPSIGVDVIGKYCSQLLIFRYADLMIKLRPPTCPDILNWSLNAYFNLLLLYILLIRFGPAWAWGSPFSLFFTLSIHFFIFCSFFTFPLSLFSFALPIFLFCPSLSFLPE